MNNMSKGQANTTAWQVRDELHNVSDQAIQMSTIVINRILIRMIQDDIEVNQHNVGAITTEMVNITTNQP